MGSGHWTQVLLFVQLDYDWIILRIHPTVSLAIYPLEDTSVDATYWLRWIVRRVAREIHTLYVDCDYFSTYLPVVETDHLAVLQLIFEGLHTDFHSVCTKLHSHQCVSVHFSWDPHEHLSFVLLIFLWGQGTVRWDLYVVFVWISTVTKNIIFFHVFISHLYCILLKDIYWIHLSICWLYYLFIFPLCVLYIIWISSEV